MNHTATKHLTASRHKGTSREIAKDMQKFRGMVAIHHKNKEGQSVMIEWRKSFGKKAVQHA